MFTHLLSLDMDEVFRALNDSSRRLLLDCLFEKDGQTLSELCEYLPEMTRYGVMNHLTVLAEGGLVATRKVGRNKHHYLNAVPIRLVHDRWINKFTEPLVGAVAGLKAKLEQGDSTMSKPTHVHEAYIRCSADAAWNAIVDGDQTVQYFYGTRVETDWAAGSPIRYLSPDGGVVADGEILSIDPPKRVEMLFHPRWDPELEAEGPVRTVWLVEEANGMTRVCVEYYDLDPAGKTYAEFVSGAPFIISGLKTWLETGESITAS